MSQNCLLCEEPYEPNGDSWNGLDPGCADEVSAYIDKFHLSESDKDREHAVKMLKFYETVFLDPLSEHQSSADIPLDEYMALAVNSYEREFLYHHVDDQALAECVLYTLQNCRPRQHPATTYEDALQVLAAELCDRLGYPVDLKKKSAFAS